MGVTAEAIADGEDGKVLYFGRIRGINTDAFNEGDVLYASTTVAGGFQTAVPLAPNNIVQVAAVINKSINQGVIFIRPSFGSNINQDEGVKIVSPTTGQLLQLQANGLWENKTTAQVLGGTSSQFVKGDGTLDSNTYQVTSEKGEPNGYASLDSNGKVPLVQINDALIGNVNFQGLWNAATNTPTLANPPASGTKGYYYIVSTAGTFASISFEVGDWIISDGTAWGKVDNTDAVSSVFGRTGNVVAANGDYTTAQVTESGNLYYTDGRARGALSFVAGSGAYNSTTGVITIPTNNNQITNGAGYITSAALGGYVQGSGSAGQVAYWSAASAITGESNLFWDATNERLGIGTATPSSILHIVDTSANATTLIIGEAGEVPTIKAGGANTDLKIEAVGLGGFIQLVTNSNPKIQINPNGNILIGTTTDAGFKLDVNGTGRFSGALNGTSASFSAGVNLATSTSAVQIGPAQSGSTFKLLTLSSNGNDLDTGTVLRLIGNSALDLVDISVRDTITRIFHQENSVDALDGYGKIQFRTNATANASFPTRGGFQFTINNTDALTIASTGAATFSSSVTSVGLLVNTGTYLGACSLRKSSDIMMIYGGSAGFEFIDHTNSTVLAKITSTGNVLIGPAQSGSTFKLLTLSSNGNDLDTGTVLRLIGNSALDLVDISVRDTTTRIYHQENTPDALDGFGKIQFRTNATANASFPTRGGFQFTIGSTDALTIASTGNVLIGTGSANSRLQVAGSFATPHTTKSANYTLDATDYTVGFDCASNRTANLPDATTCAGRIYVIYQYNTNIGLRYVTIDGNGSQTINGLTTVNLQYQDDFSSVMIQSNGSNWVVIASALYAAPV
jgi:hypothetical protein